MKLSALFGMMMFALLEVVRSQFARSYGAEAKDSLEYVLLVSLTGIELGSCWSWADALTTRLAVRPRGNY